MASTGVSGWLAAGTWPPGALPGRHATELEAGKTVRLIFLARSE
jgi:hypothetical protein